MSTYPQLPIEFKKEWIEALRSGDFNKGQGHLFDEQRNYCCLGIACQLVDEDYLNQFGNDEFILNDVPEGIPDCLIGGGDLPHKLAEMNDGSNEIAVKSFVQIADWIEKNL